MDYKQEFLNLYNTHIQRQGANELLEWITSTDFFTAPASTRYHSACAGGLCMHSVNVCNLLFTLFPNAAEPETLAICGLLHDLCKANYYKAGTRNVKNEETGAWEKVPTYNVDERFPYGHGEKSVFLAERHMKLTAAEAVAIRWHMGGFDDSVKGGGYGISKAWEKYPLGVMLHIADLQATYLVEKGTSAVNKLRGTTHG